MLVEWEDRATRDVRNIYEYLAERNGRAAIRIRNAIFAHAAILATHPEVGRRGGWPGSRELAVSRTQYILGYEISGTVAEVAPDVGNLAVGERVVGSFIMPCGRCPPCVRGRDDLCETFFALNRLKGVLYDGETRLFRDNGSPLAMYSMGGLAEYAVVPATAVFPLPDALDLHEACILGCAIPTAYG